MMRGRIVGVVLVIASTAYLLEARGFVAGFIADPIGPRAFPVLIGALLLISCLALLRAPSALPPWSWRHTGLMALLAGYVLVLNGAGFIITTTLLTSCLVALFGGPFRRGVVLSFLLSVSIFLLFVHVLAIPLPRGF